MVFTTEGFLEVATESWPEWDLNPRPPNSVQKVKFLKVKVIFQHLVSIHLRLFTFMHLRFKGTVLRIRKFQIYNCFHMKQDLTFLPFYLLKNLLQFMSIYCFLQVIKT